MVGETKKIARAGLCLYHGAGKAKRVFASPTKWGRREHPAVQAGAERRGLVLRLEVERIGHGATIADGEIDQIDGVVGLVEDVVVPEPENEPAVLLEPSVASPVSRRIGVAIAVDLDDEPSLEASKVSDERPDGFLPSESQAHLAPPEVIPEAIFCERRIGSHLACESQCSRLSVGHGGVVPRSWARFKASGLGRAPSAIEHSLDRVSPTLAVGETKKIARAGLCLHHGVGEARASGRGGRSGAEGAEVTTSCAITCFWLAHPESG
jgi:hypothetical protein